MEKVITINECFDRLNDFINPMTLHPKWLLRGQSNAGWSLQPTLARILLGRCLTRAQALQVEQEAVNKFSTSSRAILPLEMTSTLLPDRDGGLDFMGMFSQMQHYSAPTRLLDWSVSPWVALYFACKNSVSEDAAIWVIDYEGANKKANLLLEPGKGLDLFSSTSTDNVYLVLPRNSNERIEAQQGRFTMATNPLLDHADFYKNSDILKKIVIPSHLKFEIMIRLNSMNINAKTIFPGVDGLGASIGEFYNHWDTKSQIVTYVNF